MYQLMQTNQPTKKRQVNNAIYFLFQFYFIILPAYYYFDLWAAVVRFACKYELIQ